MSILNKITSLVICFTFFIVGITTANAGNDNYHALVQAAVDNPLRDEKDRKRDINRKPAQIIEFMGIKPGMAVMELLAGSGYYAEILSKVVGERGKVIALNNKAYMAFTKDAIIGRIEQSGRMENVELKIAEVNEMELAVNEMDAVFLILSYHDFYYVDEKGGWPKVNLDRTLKQLHKTLKEGGVLAVIDHAAVKGSPHETGSTLHRIDPLIVKAELSAAGFKLTRKSDVLANEMDDMLKPMYDKSIRGNTNRFVYRFIKK